MQKKSSINSKVCNILFFVGLIAAWQCVSVLGANVFHWWKSYTFPNPMGALESLISMSVSGTILRAILYSLKRVIIGFLISIVLGLLLALLILRSTYLNRNLKPLLLGVQTLPSICWVPFAILWFGLNESAIIFVVVMGSAFGTALAIENAIRTIPPIYIRAGRTMGADQKTLFRLVILPAALPEIVSGLKQTWSFSWRALMSGEVMSSVIGLGYTLNLGRDMADINQVMAVMIVIITIGVLVDKLIFEQIEYHMRKKRGLL